MKETIIKKIKKLADNKHIINLTKEDNMKALFHNLYVTGKVIFGIAILAVTFYSGMYLVSAQYDHQNPEKVLISTLEKTFADTSDQPIIHIIPERSMYEKAKARLGMEIPPRKEVVVYTKTNTNQFQVKDVRDEPSTIRKAYDSTKGALATSGRFIGDSVVNAFNYYKGLATE